MHTSETVIEPRRNWPRIEWRALWHSRHLVLLLVQREFASKFKQTLFGPLWFILQPILTAVLFSGVFGMVIRVPSDGVPPTLFYLSGLLIWTYFSQCFTGVADCLSSNAHLFSKVHIPRLILPLSVIVWNIWPWMIQFVIFAVFAFFFPHPAGGHFALSLLPSLLLVPLLIFQAALLALGAGLILSSLTVKYRDIRQLMTFISQAWLYATPIIYPPSLLSPHLRLAMMANPLTACVATLRQVFFGFAGPSMLEVGISLGVTLMFLATGLIAFGLVDSTMADII